MASPSRRAVIRWESPNGTVTAAGVMDFFRNGHAGREAP
jgi:hypothetical protein